MENNEFDYLRYVQAVLDRKRLATVIALLVMAVAIVVSYALPKKYEARSTVFVEESVINALVKGIAVTPNIDSRINALQVTMLSRTMLENVIKQLDMDVGPEGQAVDLEGLVKSLQSRTYIHLDADKGVFTISFRDKSPYRAMNFVNALTRTYIEEQTSFKREESFEATKFLAEQIELYKKRIDLAEQEIQKFKLEKGDLLATSEDALRREIEMGDQRLEAIDLSITEAIASQGYMVGTTPSKEKLSALHKNLAELKAKYTDNHPFVIQLQDEIKHLEKESKNNSREEVKEVYRSKEYQSLQLRVNALREQKKNIQQDLKKYRNMLLEWPAAYSQLLELQRKKANEEVIYEKLVARYGQSEVSKQMELQDKATTFRVLDAAVLPQRAVSPNRMLIIGGGIVGGIGVGVGVVLLIFLLNPAIGSAEDIKALGLPVLAVIPHMAEEITQRDKRKRDIKFFIGAGIIFLIVLMFLTIETIGLSTVENIIAKFH